MIYLVRHATTAWSGLRFSGVSDPELNEAGTARAAALAQWFASLSLASARVVSSPARRALATARPIAQAIGARVESDDRLTEAHFGLADGLTYDEVAQRWPEIAARLLAGETDIDWPQGETAASLRSRVRSFARDLSRAAGDAIVVTHGGPLGVLMAELSDVEVDHKIQPGEIVVLDPRSRLVLRSRDGGGPPGPHQTVED